MALSIRPGENFIVRINLLKKDGTALDIATEMNSCTATLHQTNNVVLTLTYPNANLRIGETANQLELEVTQAISATLIKGDLYLELDVVADDSDFDTALEQRKIGEKKIATVL